MKIAAISSFSNIDDQDFNIETIFKWTKKASLWGAQFVLFPELSLSGYTNSKETLLEIKDKVNSNIEKLIYFSKQYPSLALSVGYPIYEGDNIYISQSTLSNGKFLNIHLKTHLSPKESMVFTAGEFSSGTSTHENLTFGVQICFETHFPEITALLENHGAEIILMPFASPGQKPGARVKRLKKFLPARAYDNSVFIVSCNNVILGGKIKSPAVSLVLNPRGDIIKLSKGKKENYVHADIDATSISKIKDKKMSYFRKFARKMIK